MHSEWMARYELAVLAAEDAGRTARRYFPDTTAAEFAKMIEYKSDASPVTVADREAESSLRASLLTKFPDDGFLGEEFGHKTGSTGFEWIVDPIDGTRSFVRGIPLWATLVGLQYRGEMIAGVVVEPVLGNTYRALRGEGAFKNNQPIHVSKLEQLDRAIMCTSDLSYFSLNGRMSAFWAMSQKVERQRGYGDYFGFTLVAQGSADLMLDFGVHAWDIAAVIPLVEEAGGKFTDWTGKQSIQQPDALATNGRLHDASLAILKTAA